MGHVGHVPVADLQFQRYAEHDDTWWSSVRYDRPQPLVVVLMKFVVSADNHRLVNLKKALYINAAPIEETDRWRVIAYFPKDNWALLSEVDSETEAIQYLILLQSHQSDLLRRS